MNYVVLVGRIANDFEEIEENGIRKVFITLAIPRTFKNVDGIYETDYIKCMLWNGIVEKTKEYCKKGDMISIKGRLAKDYVVAEKISFITSKEVK